MKPAKPAEKNFEIILFPPIQYVLIFAARTSMCKEKMVRCTIFSREDRT